MKITPIKSIYEKDDKVSIMYSAYAKWLLIDKDEVLLPIGNSKKTFEVNGWYTVLHNFNKLQFKLRKAGICNESFVFFTKCYHKIFMVEMSKCDFSEQTTKMQCTLAEKDAIINGLKKPNTIIVDSAGNVLYANHPGAKGVKDNLNLLSEDEILERERINQNVEDQMFSRFFEDYKARQVDPNNVNIALYGSKGLDITFDHAVEFLSDTKALCTGFGVTMKGLNNYEVLLNKFEIDIKKVYEDLKSHYAFNWDEKDCLPDPINKTLRAAEKKIEQIQESN